MRKLILVLGAAAFLAAGCGGGHDNGGGAAASEGGGENTVTVQLSEQNGSGESGTATLTAQGDSTQVMVDLSNGTSTPQPAHIHEGSCANLDPQPKYALQNVVDGKSTSTVQASLDDLKSEAYAVNVHKSESDVKTYVSCGDIGGTGSGASDDDSGSGY
jgi:hypothetical protein